jgi:predicted ATP-grasp superfamily ATP-dependent carboligase
MAATLALAGVSARLVAERAARDGYRVVALDCFGDVDTRRVAARWYSIASDAAALAIDAGKLLAALAEVASTHDAIGWIAGSGFEASPALVERGAARLPLVGCASAQLARLRAPRVFFARLDALGVPHPQVRFEAPRERAGWLRKDGGGHGGWHVRRASADEPALGEREYFQREASGVPMSASFIAARGAARVLGFNRMLVRRFGARAFVHAGCIGPLAPPRRAAEAVEDHVAALTREFALQGLASLDFLLDGAAVSLLEVNARPSASIALYGDGLLRAHVDACLQGVLPPPHATLEGVAGQAIVYARRAFVLGEGAAAHLAATEHCHDLPHAGTRFATGDPVCSVEARAADAAALEALLAARRTAIEDWLEMSK